MVNYIYGIAKGNSARNLKVWAEKTISPKDFTFESGGSSIFISSTNQSQKNFSRKIDLGYIIDHERKRIHLGDFRDIGESTLNYEGCFLRAQSSEFKTTIQNDVFGLVPIFYFENDNIACFSDSLLALTEIRKAVGLSIDLNEEEFIARSQPVTITTQLISSETGIAGVRYALPGSVIICEHGELSKISVKVSHPGASRVFSSIHAEGPDEQVALIRAAAEEMAGFVGAMISLDRSDVSFDLSGGLDSRTVLAAAMAADISSESFSVGSAPHQVQDFQIAREICMKFNLRFGRPRVTGEIVPTNQMALWLANSASVYNPIYCSSSRSTKIGRIISGGQGAEVYKGNYGWRPMLAVGSKFAPEVQELFHKLTFQGLRDFGIDPDDPHGTEWHYLAFRNAIHGSRLFSTSSLCLRPLLNRSLVSLSRSYAKNGFVGSKNLISDLLIALSPELASIPFDDPKKDMSLQSIAQRSVAIGRVKRVPPYQVFGTLEAASLHPVHGLLRIARKKGFSGPFNHAAILGLLKDAMEIAPKGVAPYSEMLFDLASASLPDPVRASHPAAMAAGKLLSFHLLS